MKKLDIEGN
jgi:Ca2+-binding EF-hand superfamily protein